MAQQLSIVQICSNALHMVGEDSITSLTDGTKRANICNSHFGTVRDQALEDFKPKFAKKYATITPDVTDPSFEWDSRFLLPSDYITMLEVYPATKDYEITGDYIYADETSIKIKYIARITDSTKWTPQFAGCVELGLAAVLALVFQPQLARSLNDAYELKRTRSRISDSQQNPSRPIEADTLITVRYV